MATTVQTAPAPVSPPLEVRVSITPALIAVMVWQTIVAIGLFFAAVQLFQIETFFNLGNFVPRFVGILAAGVGVAALASNLMMLNATRTTVRLGTTSSGIVGRLIGILINFFGFGFSVILFLHFAGFFIGIDDLARGVFLNSTWLLGLPIGYGLVWLSQKFDESGAIHEWGQKLGLGVMMLTVVIILWNSGLLNSLGTLLSAFGRIEVIGSAAAIVLFLTMGTILLRNGERFGETIPQRESWQGWLFLLPNFLNFMLFFALPLILSFYLSFTDYDAVSSADWIGIDNYTRMLSIDAVSVPLTATTGEINAALRQNHFEIFRIVLGDNALVIGARDPLFWLSLGTTIRYCIFLLILAILPALGLALLLNSRIPGMTFFRAVYFLPSIAAVVGVAMIWQWLYNPVIGYINYAITGIVNFLNGIFGGGITDPRIDWLTNDNIMLYSAVIMAAWQVIGFNTVILLAGLQGVPKDLIEASTVDGANAWTRLRSILLPLIAPTMFFVTVTTLISGLQAFSEMYVLFGNSTSNARLTTVFYLYQQGFQRFQMGYASATAWVLFAFIFVITLIQFRLSSRNKAYAD